MNRLASILALVASLAIATPVCADQILPPGRITQSNDILFGALKLGKREAGKTIITPDTLQILGAGSVGDVTDMSVRTPKTPDGQSLAAFLASSARSVLDYIPRQFHAAILAGTNTTDLTGWINNALNDTNNASVTFPAGGRYNVTGLRVNRPDLTLLAYRARIQNAKGSENSTLLVPAGSDRVRIYGGDWQGAGELAYTGTVPNSQGIHFAGANEGHVEDAYVHDAHTCGICFEGSSYSTARGNTVRNIFFGPGIGQSFANYNTVTDNYTFWTYAEGITSDNTSHHNTVERNHVTKVGYNPPGANPPPGFTGGCFGGIGAGASSNYSSFSYNIISETACLGIGFHGTGNKFIGNTLTRTGLATIGPYQNGGIWETYYSGNKSDGTCCIVSDQGNNTFIGNFSDAAVPLKFEHDTGANFIGANVFPNGPVADETNGTTGNRYASESGFVLVNSTATAVLTHKAFGKYVQVQGATDWKVTLPPADQQAGGRIEIFCNSAPQTIKPPAGGFGGPYGGGATTKTCPSNASMTFRSDGFGWQIIHSSVN